MRDGFLCLEEPIPITDSLIHWITRLPYEGENLAMIFSEKGGEQAFTDSMKENFKPMNKPCRYAISSICDPAMKVSTTS